MNAADRLGIHVLDAVHDLAELGLFSGYEAMRVIREHTHLDDARVVSA